MKTLGLLTSALITLTLSTGSVWAGPHHHGKGKFLSMFDVNQDGMVTLDELTEAGKARFAKMDGNGDSVVDKDEFQAHMGEHRDSYKQQRFAKIDSNGDGQISQDEFTEYKRQKAQDRFAKMDENGDGQLSMEEFSSHRKGHHGKWGHHGGYGHKGGSRIFDKLDGNADGQITLEEALAAWSKWFNKLDSNNDQTVTSEEASMGYGHGKAHKSI